MHTKIDVVGSRMPALTRTAVGVMAVASLSGIARVVEGIPLHELGVQSI